LQNKIEVELEMIAEQRVESRIWTVDSSIAGNRAWGKAEARLLSKSRPPTYHVDSAYLTRDF